MVPVFLRRWRGEFSAAVAAGVLLGSLAAAGQQPGTLPPPGPPPPAALEPAIPSAQLAFLAGLAGQPTKALMKDKQFRALMKLVIPNTTFHYAKDISLEYAVQLVIGEPTETTPVEVEDGRYVTVAGVRKVGKYGRALLWFDLQTGQALGMFFWRPSNGEPTPTLTVFSKQLTDTTLSMGQLPPAFERKVVEWSQTHGMPTVSPRYFIPANGRKYALLHDEDYCANPPITTRPQPPCEQLNADAAEADMDAAYFMAETGNAANATAWMLEPEQIAWIGLRERTCGAGLACRIAFTRRRTIELIHRPVQVRRR